MADLMFIERRIRREENRLGSRVQGLGPRV